MSSAQSKRLLTLLIVVFFGAMLRFTLIFDLYEWPDEIWSLWHVRGSLSDAVIRTPYDWPPGYTMITWLWVQLAGPTLEANRALTVFFGILALAAVYQAARILFHLTGKLSSHDELAASATSIVLAIMGYAIFAAIDVRAYGLLIMLGAFALWLAARWLNHPTRRRAFPLILVLALMVYASFTSIPYLLFLSLFVLVMKPRLFGPWFAIGLAVFVLTLPEIPRFLASASGRIGSVMPQPLPPLPEALNTIYTLFGGSQIFVFVLAAAVMLLVALFIRRPNERRLIVLLVLWIAFPIMVYFTAGNNEFMKPRYMWWMTPGLALTMGFALRALSTKALRLIIPAVALISLQPVDYSDYRMSDVVSPPFRMVFSWLAKHIQPGDVLVVDPECACGVKTGWDYFVPLYFPSGVLPIADAPGDASRVWYLSSEVIGQTPELVAEVQKDRRAAEFVGPWNFIARLYEAAPDRVGVSYGGRVRFHGVQFVPDLTIMGRGDQLMLRLWWSAEEPLDSDYSITVRVVNQRGQLVAQADGPAIDPDTPEPTSAWQPGVIYQDSRTIILPDNIASGSDQYTVLVGVYQWWDGMHLLPEVRDGWERAGANQEFVVLRRLEINVY